MSQYEENTSIVMKLSGHYSLEVITYAAYRVSVEKGFTIVFKDSKYVDSPQFLVHLLIPNAFLK